VARVLVKGGCVLSFDRRVGNLEDADVLVDGDEVAEVGPGLRARDAEIVDASRCIVMPGFVDTHRRTWTSLLRHRGVAEPPGAADPAGGRSLRPDDLYAATLIGLLGALDAGITTVVDWCDVAADERATEAALRAHADAGVRTVFVHAEPRDRSAAADDDASLRRTLAHATDVAGPATTVAFGTADLAGPDPDRIAASWSLARELGLRIHARAGATAADRGVVAGLGDRGLLGADVTLVVSSHLDDGDLAAIAEHGVAVSLTPSADLAAGRGAPPLQPLIDRGVRPGLGVGDERTSPGDLFAQMRSAQSIQHATLFERKLAGKAGVPALLSTRDVIRYATVDGARVAGVGDLVGSLGPGRKADLVLLRTDRPNIAPVNDPIGAVVWGMDASNLDLVLVDGRPRRRGGVLDADVEGARTLAVAAAARVTSTGTALVETGGDGGRP
jgi:5-methylthioadenosine/S-adenosylhomocysteine deaminase